MLPPPPPSLSFFTYIFPGKVEQVVFDLVKAINDKNPEALQLLFTKDTIGMPPGRPMFIGREGNYTIVHFKRLVSRGLHDLFKYHSCFFSKDNEYCNRSIRHLGKKFQIF